MDSSKDKHALPLKIAIVGAGFSGTALAATFYRISNRPVEIVLLDKRGHFGAGDAYSTPFPFHLLNVRAQDMSALEDEPGHFVNWLNTSQAASACLDKSQPCGEQFVPRFLYGDYLKYLLDTIQSDSAAKTKLTLEDAEVIDIIPSQTPTLVLKDQRKISVNKVVLAVGNHPPATFPFSVSSNVNCIQNPWDYLAPKQIGQHDPVLIVGTGLSMIDAVLTLYHQHHQGRIFAVSRHGLLPLPHADVKVPCVLIKEQLPHELRALTKYLRLKSKKHIDEGHDWRSVVNALRVHVPDLWQKMSLSDRKCFLRHALPYWNIHRHRVHEKIAGILSQLMASHQLTVLGGRILSVENNLARIKLRSKQDISQIEIKWLINCMGPSSNMASVHQPLIHALLTRGMAMLDPLDLGFAVSASGALRQTSANVSSSLYTLGPPARGTVWECSAVPEIRKQCFHLATHLLNTN